MLNMEHIFFSWLDKILPSYSLYSIREDRHKENKYTDKCTLYYQNMRKIMLLRKKKEKKTLENKPDFIDSAWWR